MRKSCHSSFTKALEDLKPSTEDNLENSMLEKQIESSINHHLEAIVGAFKAQIPMASLVLGKTREEKLKEQARQELFKIIPDIKRMTKEQDKPSETLIRASLQNLANQFDKEFCKGKLYVVLAAALLFGILLGLIEVGLISLFT